MTTLFFKPGEYLAGAFSSDTEASSYLSSMPEGQWEVRRIASVYPFGLWEHDGEFLLVDINERPSAGILHKINADFRPVEPWTDEMGRLPHIHCGEVDDG